MIKKVFYILVPVLLWFDLANAQLGFCQGIPGAPIFEETFGFGKETSVLPIFSSAYTFAEEAPEDGFYTVSPNTFNWHGWHEIEDHTLGDFNGKMLIINADFNVGEFYRTKVSGLCGSTFYEFSSWMINLLPKISPSCPDETIPINVSFEIWDITETIKLASGNTGNIEGTSEPVWEQYALVFKTRPEQTSVILKMKNNGAGGCGNDLAIDDIVFKSCSPKVEIKDSSENVALVEVCPNQIPYTTILSTVFQDNDTATYFYQWQTSKDGENWLNLKNESDASYKVSDLNENTFYRVLISEELNNIGNDLCQTVSNVFKINLASTPEAPISKGDVKSCKNDAAVTSLAVHAPEGSLVDWYNSPEGGLPILENSFSFIPESEGTYYAQSKTRIGGCVSSTRTPVKLEYIEAPDVKNEIIQLCEGSSLVLSAEPANLKEEQVSYRWENGEVTPSITVSKTKKDSVNVYNGLCYVTKTIEVLASKNPVIDNIKSEGSDIIVNLPNSEEFLYSLDNINFQKKNVFKNIDNGHYAIYIRPKFCQESIIEHHSHFSIPKFFTPNGDGYHDTFDLKGIENYDNTQISIFDRYGRLLKYTENGPFSWDGTFKNQILPEGGYWYVVILGETIHEGHFTLKR